MLSSKESQCCKKTSIGGQAVIEGIMMKGPNKTVLAVRNTSNEIILEDVPSVSLKDKYPILKLPIIRGVLGFIESMTVGYKTLMRSADLSGFTELEEEKDKDKPKSKSTELLMNVVMVIATILGVALALALFMYAPTKIFNFINSAAGGTLDVFRGLIEGVMKITLFVAYVLLVSMTKDIKRVFMYHGAEHKTIFCYEKGEELNVENVRKQSRFHPRCGTSFMFLMIAVSIIISTLITLIFPAVTKITALWIAIKILLVPLFCGLGYELIKFCGRHDNLLTKIVAAPGLWVQRITTKEPDDAMIEVAIQSILAVIPENQEDDRW
ncbi:MAG: DUF1385 domain-containing protein [Clostridia bacterium]|nr:DUF1385 domain-containing protein [Clostridia bacterium]